MTQNIRKLAIQEIIVFMSVVSYLLLFTSSETSPSSLSQTNRKSSLTSAGAVVRVQQVTIATGAVESSDVVVTEVITEEVFITTLAALIHVCRDGRRTRMDRHRQKELTPQRLFKGVVCKTWTQCEAQSNNSCS